jgi:hypothetical protein
MRGSCRSDACPARMPPETSATAIRRSTSGCARARRRWWRWISNCSPGGYSSRAWLSGRCGDATSCSAAFARPEAQHCRGCWRWGSVRESADGVPGVEHGSYSSGTSVQRSSWLRWPHWSAGRCDRPWLAPALIPQGVEEAHDATPLSFPLALLHRHGAGLDGVAPYALHLGRRVSTYLQTAYGEAALLGVGPSLRRRSAGPEPVPPGIP